jgi:hypothetical protein
MLTAWLIGCGKETESPSTSDALERDLAELHSAIDSVKRHQESLTISVDGFGYTNWREVVPEVQNDAEEIQRAVERLERAEQSVRDGVDKLVQAENDADRD